MALQWPMMDRTQGLPDYRGSGRDADNVENQSDFDDQSVRSEDQAEGIQSTESIISVTTSDSQLDDVNTNDNQTNATPVASDERVSGQTETRQNSSDDNSNDQNKSNKLWILGSFLFTNTSILFKKFYSNIRIKNIIYLDSMLKCNFKNVFLKTLNSLKNYFPPC